MLRKPRSSKNKLQGVNINCSQLLKKGRFCWLYIVGTYLDIILRSPKDHSKGRINFMSTINFWGLFYDNIPKHTLTCEIYYSFTSIFFYWLISTIAHNSFFLWNLFIYLNEWLLGPYNTSVTPYCYCSINPLLLLLCPCIPHIFIIVPHGIPLVLLLCPYIIIVMPTLIILWPLRILYIESRFIHLNHPIIIHLRNVKEDSPSKLILFKSFLSIFFYFVSLFNNIWY